MSDIEDLESLMKAPLADQAQCFESTLEKLDEDDLAMIDELCKKIVIRLRYANIKRRIDYADGLELLAKLGIFLSLNSKDEHHG